MTPTDFPPKSNPAGRLWHLVQDARKHQGEPMPVGLAKLFNCSKDDYAALLRGLSNFVELTNEVERLMHKVPRINAKKHLGWIGPVRDRFSYLTIGSNQTMATVLSAFDEPTMGLVSICSDHLETYCPEPAADEAGVRRLLDDALRLHAEIAASDLDLAIREYMLRHLRLVVDALFDYRTKGFESLWNGLAAIKGHSDMAVLRTGLAPGAIKNSPLWPKVVAVVSALIVLVDNAERVDFVLEKAGNVRQLVGGSVPALPPPDASSPDHAAKPAP